MRGDGAAAQIETQGATTRLIAAPVRAEERGANSPAPKNNEPMSERFR